MVNFYLLYAVTPLNNKLAQEGTTVTHTPPGDATPPRPHTNCPASLTFHCSKRICMCLCVCALGVGWGVGGQLCTAGSISGLTLDANVNIGLGIEQS